MFKTWKMVMFKENSHCSKLSRVILLTGALLIGPSICTDPLLIRVSYSSSAQSWNPANIAPASSERVYLTVET